jgi:hypothetical protein
VPHVKYGEHACKENADIEVKECNFYKLAILLRPWFYNNRLLHCYILFTDEAQFNVDSVRHSIPLFSQT